MNDARLQVAFGGLHPDRVRDLYASHGPERTLRRLAGGAIKTTARVRSAVAVPADVRREQLGTAGIRVLYRGEDGFPQGLADMPDSPDLLFVRGELSGISAVAVVGTRRCTSYGRRIATEYGRAIAAAGWPLISGLARGIDGAAHSGTLARNGVGVAVLGSGIDVMYPREHAEIAVDLIANGGAVISESPPGTPPEAWRFPPRNRIISGLVDAVVVVEATVRGGALITAEAALRHGNQVFAVPGDVGRASSAGCNLLIRDGAAPVHDPADLIESLELVLGPAPQAARQRDETALGDLDHTLVDLIRSGVVDVDSIVGCAAAGPAEVLAALGGLELAGVLQLDGAGRYAIV
jgi:DNA processing protein